MSKVVKEFSERIEPEKRWRMRVNKRFYEKYHTQDLIENLTKHVDRPNVDLENPDKTNRVEIIGEEAPISPLKPQEHFSVNDIKDEVLTTKE
jgi:tRNA(Ser,Leu) C12 N-acetylase TAN1